VAQRRERERERERKKKAKEETEKSETDAIKGALYFLFFISFSLKRPIASHQISIWCKTSSLPVLVEEGK